MGKFWGHLITYSPLTATKLSRHFLFSWNHCHSTPFIFRHFSCFFSQLIATISEVLKSNYCYISSQNVVIAFWCFKQTLQDNTHLFQAQYKSNIIHFETEKATLPLTSSLSNITSLISIVALILSRTELMASKQQFHLVSDSDLILSLIHI